MLTRPGDGEIDGDSVIVLDSEADALTLALIDELMLDDGVVDADTESELVDDEEIDNEAVRDAETVLLTLALSVNERVTDEEGERERVTDEDEERERVTDEEGVIEAVIDGDKLTDSESVSDDEIEFDGELDKLPDAEADKLLEAETLGVTVDDNDTDVVSDDESVLEDDREGETDVEHDREGLKVDEALMLLDTLELSEELGDSLALTDVVGAVDGETDSEAVTELLTEELGATDGEMLGEACTEAVTELDRLRDESVEVVAEEDKEALGDGEVENDSVALRVGEVE